MKTILMSIIFSTIFIIGCGGENSSSPIPVVPMTEQLKFGNKTEKEHGIAIMLVVDSSGSMASWVGSEKSKTKIENARTAIVNVASKISDFSAKNKDKNVILGVMSFSTETNLVYIGEPNVPIIKKIVENIEPGGGTCIGSALYHAKIELNKRGYDQKYIILISDGENTGGKNPIEVSRAMKELSGDDACSVFVIGFDVNDHAYDGLKQNAMVFNASDSKQLNQTLDFVLDKKILLEK